MSSSFLGSIRWFIVCLQLPLRILHARTLGASVGKNVKMVGALRIKRARGARIEIGDSVCIYSHPVANEVIGRRCSTLWDMTPSALLKLEDHVGCSSVCICAASEIRVGEGTILGADTMILDNDFHLPLPGWKWTNAAA